jgi:hypothetical protein
MTVSATTTTPAADPRKLNARQARSEARKLRAEGWTVSELRSRYGRGRWDSSWLEGIPAPVSTLAPKVAALAADAKGNGKGKTTATVAAQASESDAPTTPAATPVKVSGAAGSRPDASAVKTERRTVSKAAAARQSSKRGQAAKAAAAATERGETLESGGTADVSTAIAEGHPSADAEWDAAAPVKGDKRSRRERVLDATKPTAAKPKPATSKPASGSGASGRTLTHRKPSSDDEVRYIRRRYAEEGGKNRAAIAAEVTAKYGHPCNPMTVFKIGTRVSRANVPDKPDTTATAERTAAKAKTTAAAAKPAAKRTTAKATTAKAKGTARKPSKRAS